MSDLGKGDVVEAVRNMKATWLGSTITVAAGSRAIVEEIGPEPTWTRCSCRGLQRGLLLREYPLWAGCQWCPCGWRKIGGSQADTARRFREDLSVGPGLPTTIPETVTA